VTPRQRLSSFRSPVAVFAAALAVLLLAFHALGPGALPALRYERAAVLAGEAWRLVTGHLVHADLAHLGWNLLGLLIVALLFARDYAGWQWVVILLSSTAATDLGFLLLEPQLEWYVGFSGVLHGLMAAGLVAWLRTSRDAITWIVTALFAAKLAWEHVVGPLPFTAGSLPVPVVHEAHTYGAIGGLLAGLWLTRRTPGPASL
jgi:rhomboid family GlyGly-CTERM serine protease